MHDLININRLFGTLEKEGLYDGRITVAGKEYAFPEKSNISGASNGKSHRKLEKLLKYGSIFIILLLIGFILLNLPVKKNPVSDHSPDTVAKPAIDDLPGHGGGNPSITGEAADNITRELNLAGITFYPVNSNEYTFSYLSGKIFFHNISITGSDVRLIVNDMIDRVNKQARRTRLEAAVLTPRYMTNKHHVKLWQNGYLEKGQVFMLRAGEAVLVKETNNDLIGIDEITDWETLCVDKTIFIRIMLRKAED